MIIILIASACNLPGGTSTEEPDAQSAAEMTLTAISLENTPTESQPTFTPLPSLTPTLESTSTPSFTNTPTFAYVTLSEGTNCRSGATTQFDILETFPPNITIEVVGKHPFDNYYYVRSPNNPSLYCWMWGFYATGANLQNVPVMTPPPTPTPGPVPDFSAEYVDTGKCIGWYSRFNLTNTGAFTFKSSSVQVTDTVSNDTQVKTLNGFQGVDSCIATPITSELKSGEAFIVTAPVPSVTPGSHKYSASIILCTELDQSGQCVTVVVEYTP